MAYTVIRIGKGETEKEKGKVKESPALLRKTGLMKFNSAFGLVESTGSAAEYVAYFVVNQFLDLFSCMSEIFTRTDFLRSLRKHLTNVAVRAKRRSVSMLNPCAELLSWVSQ